VPQPCTVREHYELDVDLEPDSRFLTPTAVIREGTAWRWPWQRDWPAPRNLSQFE